MRVFVCHASEDKPQVRELCRQMLADGFDPWVDDEQLLPGHDWELELSQAVRTSDAVIVCVSAVSVRKVGYLQKELRLVLDAAEYRPEGMVFVVPVRLEECELPLRLTRWQYADLFVPDGYDRLRLALTRTENEPLKKPEREQMPPYRARKSWQSQWLTMAAVLILIGAAITTYFLRRVSLTNVTSTVTPSIPSTETTPTPPEMVLVAGGIFLMGRSDGSDPASYPAHEVRVNPFFLDRTPITNSLFHDFQKSAQGIPRSYASNAAEMPATGVTWDEAGAYCLAAGKRLPTEAEWEFAAKGTDGRLYPWGSQFSPSAANTIESGSGHSESVGTRSKNISPYGALDMSGNVWQWCADDYQIYPGGPVLFSIEAGSKAIRGGAYSSDARHATTTTRNLALPSTRSPAIGFRCAK